MTRRIVLELSTTLKAATALAQTLLRSDESDLTVFHGLSLRFDRPAFEAGVDARIAEAVEMIVPARRGRPPASNSAP